MEDLNLEDIRKKCLKSLYSCTVNIAKYLNNQKEAEYNKLRFCVQSYCKLDLDHTAMHRALQAIQDESDLDALETRYQEELVKNTNTRADLKSHPYYVELENHINDAERVSNAEEDTDIAVTETQETFIDPITQSRIKNPVRNTKCKHVYEKAAIVDYLKERGKKCPYSGCKETRPIEIKHLVPDEELRQRLASTVEEESESQ